MTIDDIRNATPEARRFVSLVAGTYSFSHVPQEDLEQEAWAGLLAHIDSYDPGRGDITNWAAAISRRSITNLLSSGAEWKPEQEEVLEDHPEEASEASQGPFVVPRDPNPSPEDKILVAELLEPLSPYQRNILTMYYVDDMTQREIAKELGVSKSKICRDIKETVGHIRISSV